MRAVLYTSFDLLMTLDSDLSNAPSRHLWMCYCYGRTDGRRSVQLFVLLYMHVKAGTTREALTKHFTSSECSNQHENMNGSPQLQLHSGEAKTFYTKE